jgi:uncharacterized protein DUF4177
MRASIPNVPADTYTHVIVDGQICRVAESRLRVLSSEARSAGGSWHPVSSAVGYGNSRRLGVMEYKVLTQQDRRWSGKFSPENLEQTLNSYAAEGWRVVSTVPVASPWTISTSQVMILLERDTPAG